MRRSIENRPDRYPADWNPDRFNHLKAELEAREWVRQQAELKRRAENAEFLPEPPEGNERLSESIPAE